MQKEKNESLSYFRGDELSTSVWLGKYALKDTSGNMLEKTPDDMHMRLAKEFARIESNYSNPISLEIIFGLFKDFKYLVPQGSPMFGVGNDYKLTSLSNCFVIGDEVDSYGSIMKLDEEQIQLMKRRGGVGHDLSHIRPKGAVVNNAALTSTGVVPFMERYSNSTREVAQDGRRGALMLSILVNHPDAESFIDAKLTEGKITGANISVKITDDFMKAVKEDLDFLQTFPVNIEPLEDYDEVLKELKYNELTPCLDKYNGKFYVKKIKARKLWDKIIHNAWKSAEPGILFWDKIIAESPADCYGEEWKTISTNPCVIPETLVFTNIGWLEIQNLKKYKESHADLKIITVDKEGVIFGSELKDAFITKKDAKLKLIKFSNNESLLCTPEHELYFEDFSLIQVQKLKEGDLIIGGNNTLLEVVSVEDSQRISDVWDLTAVPNYNFFSLNNRREIINTDKITINNDLNLYQYDIISVNGNITFAKNIKEGDIIEIL